MRRSSATLLRSLGRLAASNATSAAAEARGGVSACSAGAWAASAHAVRTVPSMLTTPNAAAGQPCAFATWASDIISWDEDSQDVGVWHEDVVAKVGQRAPNFVAPAVVDGEITKVKLSDYINQGSYVVLFFYPKDWTFVCPTEIIAFSDRAKEFEQLNCKVLAVSTDTENSHLAWIKHPRERGGLGYMQIPVVADPTKRIAEAYDVLIEEQGIALRGLFIINPKGVIQQATINDLPIGRSVDETLRLLQAIQYVAEHGEVCPADWKPGAPTMQADPEKSLEYFASAAKQGAEEEFGSQLHPIRSRRDYEQLVSSGKTVVVDFMAPWCGKCKMLAPHVDKLQEQHPDITFAKFDTTLEPLEGLAAELGVKALPAFHFFKGGKAAREPITGYKKQLLTEAVEKL